MVKKVSYSRRTKLVVGLLVLILLLFSVALAFPSSILGRVVYLDSPSDVDNAADLFCWCNNGLETTGIAITSDYQASSLFVGDDGEAPTHRTGSVTCSDGVTYTGEFVNDDRFYWFAPSPYRASLSSYRTTVTRNLDNTRRVTEFSCSVGSNFFVGFSNSNSFTPVDPVLLEDFDLFYELNKYQEYQSLI